MSWSESLTEAGYDVPVTVCLTHGRFIPCRKPGPHVVSIDVHDVEKVRYFQDMSAREARQPAPRPEYEEDTTTWQEQWLVISAQYGEYYLCCPGFTLEPVQRGGSETVLVLKPCRQSFSYRNYAKLGEDLQQHYATVGHYQVKQTGRDRNAEPGTRKGDSQ